jgi:uncharacterized protein
MSERKVRVAAVGDFHFDERARGTLTELIEHVNRNADVLAMVGDLTTHGRPEQVGLFLEEIRAVDVPMVTVLGNHDHEADRAVDVRNMLTEGGVTVLDGEAVEIEGIGFTGVKGFAGGFGRLALGPFGERLMKEFVDYALAEALKLERGLRELTTEHRVVLLHYAPIEDTVGGEPEPVYPFLGSSRLLDPIETLGADVVFHGHAHHGTYRGRTPSGIPVFNVCSHVLAAEGLRVHIHEVPAPERRAEGRGTGTAEVRPGPATGRRAAP